VLAATPNAAAAATEPFARDQTSSIGDSAAAAHHGGGGRGGVGGPRAPRGDGNGGPRTPHGDGGDFGGRHGGRGQCVACPTGSTTTDGITCVATA
jgi:hypothetical protein